MWRVASEAYAYLAGHPFLTDIVLHNRKTDNDRQIINKQHAAAEISRQKRKRKKNEKNSTNRSRPIAYDLTVTPAILRNVNDCDD